MSIEHVQKVLKLKTMGKVFYGPRPFIGVEIRLKIISSYDINVRYQIYGFYVTKSIGDVVFMFRPSPKPLAYNTPIFIPCNS